MASLFKLKGRYVIDVRVAGKVRRLSAGKNKKTAIEFHQNVEALVECRERGVELPARLVAWLAVLTPAEQRRLARIGLVSESRSNTIGDLLEVFEAHLLNMKPNTQRNYKNTSANLKRYFGADKPVEEITPEDAMRYRHWLQTKGCRYDSRDALAEATVGRRITQCRRLFKLAVRQGWIEDNPFANIKAGKQTNPSRSFYVSPEIVAQLIPRLSSDEMRLAFELLRWCGVRPGELKGLTWAMVDFESRAITFRSPKTEHFKGKEYRRCPLFPEVAERLQTAFIERTGAYVLPTVERWENPRQMLYKEVIQACRLAEVTPWPKMFTNMRASRATEIEAEFGAKAESEWIGHGSDVALKHYLMVTDQIWERATQIPEKRTGNN
jgi:integrase